MLKSGLVSWLLLNPWVSGILSIRGHPTLCQHGRPKIYPLHPTQTTEMPAACTQYKQVRLIYPVWSRWGVSKAGCKLDSLSRTRGVLFEGDSMPCPSQQIRQSWRGPRVWAHGILVGKGGRRRGVQLGTHEEECELYQPLPASLARPIPLLVSKQTLPSLYF